MHKAAAFLESYFIARREHEIRGEAAWQTELRPFFSEKFLDSRAEATLIWGTLPKITETEELEDGTMSIVAEREDSDVRCYILSGSDDDWKIDKIMVQCEICEGAGRIELEIEGEEIDEVCDFCEGEGWEEVLD